MPKEPCQATHWSADIRIHLKRLPGNEFLGADDGKWDVDVSEYPSYLTTLNTTVDKNAVAAHFLAKFTDLQSRFDASTDVFESMGKRFLEATIGRFVDHNEPITIVLPRFPTKTPSHGGKVLGPLPDHAEELALARLEIFCSSIEEVYPIGCKVTIFSDGRVFGDLVGAPLDNIRAYKNGLKALVEDAGHTHIQFDGLESYTKTDDPVQEVLERFHINQMDMDARLDATIWVLPNRLVEVVY